MAHATDNIQALIAVSAPRQARILCRRYGLPLPARHASWLADHELELDADELRHEREESAILNTKRL